MFIYGMVLRSVGTLLPDLSQDQYSRYKSLRNDVKHLERVLSLVCNIALYCTLTKCTSSGFFVLFSFNKAACFTCYTYKKWNVYKLKSRTQQDTASQELKYCPEREVCKSKLTYQWLYQPSKVLFGFSSLSSKLLDFLVFDIKLWRFKHVDAVFKSWYPKNIMRIIYISTSILECLLGG